MNTSEKEKSPAPLRVLFLEDNPRDAKLTKGELERQGYQLDHTLTDSPQAFQELLAKGEYDLILADFNLGSWTALDALEILRRSGKDIPFILLSGTIGDEAAVECIKQGAADYVLKDRAARLPVAIERALQDKRLRVENARAFEAASRLATIVELSGDAIVGSTPEGIITSWNQGAEKLYGYSAAEMVGQRLATLFPSEQPNELAEIHEKLNRGERIERLETMRVGKDGSRVDVSLSVFPLTDARGEVTGYASIARDIRERTRAEAALHESEQLFNAFMDNNPAVAFMRDDQGRYVYVNRAFARMAGKTSSEIVGKNISTLWSQSIAKPLENNDRTVLAQDRPFEFPERTQSPDGTETEWLAIKFPFRDSKGKRFVGCVSIDVTQARRAEAALRESEERFRRIAETIDEVFWIADPAMTKMHYISPGYERVWGRFVASLYENPRSFLESIHPEDRDRVIAVLQTQTDGRPFEHDYRIVRPDGSTRWIWDRGFPVRAATGEVASYVGVAQDITARKVAEAENLRLATAIEQSAEAVMITDPHGTIEYVNPAFTRITGYGREDVLGGNPRILKSGKQEPEFYRHLWETILSGKSWQGEIVNRRKNGTLYHERTTIAPVRNTRGEVTHFIDSKEDVTERKNLEIQLQQAAKMEAVGRLAGGVAHDFNNLLTIINGYSELVLGRLHASDPLRNHIEEIRKAGVRAASLTRQLLAFSRQQVLAPRVLDLNSLISDVEKMLRRLIGEDIDLALVLDSALGKVKADPGQIEQILMNLAVNARDAMPEGGKLIIETANVELDGTYTYKRDLVTPGTYVMLAVIDTGTGMSPETQAHIFEPFFTTKERDKGTGLGLATVYGIVKQSGGFIWVYSELGQGTTFKIYLPKVGAIAKPLPSSKAQESPVTGSETILLIEDEEAVRALAASILGGCGYKILECRSPADALQIAERHQGAIDLLLTDVVLPGMNGRKIAEHLSSLRPGMRVLYMSGYTDDTVLRSGVLETGSAFLQKPFTPANLARKVRDALDAASEIRHSG